MGNEHVIPEFVNRFNKLKGKKFIIQGNGSETRSFIYIDDFVRAFKYIIKKENIFKFIHRNKRKSYN